MTQDAGILDFTLNSLISGGSIYCSSGQSDKGLYSTDKNRWLRTIVSLFVEGPSTVDVLLLATLINFDILADRHRES